MTGPAAGWYDDPTEPDLLRYWDGTAWTPHRMPRPDASGSASTAPAPTTEPSPPATVDSDSTASDPLFVDKPSSGSKPEADGDETNIAARPNLRPKPLPKADQKTATVQHALAPTAYDRDRRRAMVLIGLGVLGLLGILAALFLFDGGDDDSNGTTAAEEPTPTPVEATVQPQATPEPQATLPAETPTEAPTAVPATPTPAPTSTPTPTPDPWQPIVDDVAPALVRVEAVGCGTVEFGSALLVPTGTAVTAQPVVTLSERVALLAPDGSSTLSVYQGITEQGVAVLSTAASADLTPVLVDPTDGQEVVVVWLDTDAQPTHGAGTIVAISDTRVRVELVDSSLTPARGAVVLATSGDVVGILREITTDNLLVSRSGPSLTEIDIPEGPNCGDADEPPPAAALDVAQQVTDSRVRQLALSQVLVSALATQDWATASQVAPEFADLSESELDFFFQTWRHAVPIPLNNDNARLVIGVVVHAETEAGVKSTVLDCTVWEVTGDTFVAVPDDLPPTVLSADSWLDTGAQRNKAKDLCSQL